MAILNYTTDVPVERTAAEIQQSLVKARARAVMMEYDARGVLTHLAFRVDTEHGAIAFRLPANVQGVHRVLLANPRLSRREQSREQAARVAWRILKRWVDAQPAIIEAAIAALPEVLLPYAQVAGGDTVYERFKSKGLPALGYDPS